jgi:hypothetical protein
MMLQPVTHMLLLFCASGLFAEHEDGVSSAVPTQQEIEAAALYVKTLSKIPKQASKGVYKNEFGASLSSEKLNVVLAHEWLSDDVSLQNQKFALYS